MKGTKRLRVAAAFVTACYLLILGALYQMQRSEVPQSRELSLQAALPVAGDEAGGMKFILEGGGFDERTRVSLVLDAANRRAVLSEIASWGNLKDAAISGNVLLVVHHSRGLMAFDLTDPLRPRLLDTLRVSGTPFKLALSGDHVFLCAREGGVHVINISDPRDLRLVATVETGGLAIGIVQQGETAFVANSVLGLQALDIADLSAPRLIGTLKVSRPLALALRGRFVFLAAAGEGLHVVEIDDPEAMRLVATLDTVEPLLAVSVEGDYAFGAAMKEGMLTIDIRDPLRPTVVNAARGPFMARDVRLDRGRAYVVNTAGGVQIFDIGNPRAPKHLGSIEISGQVHGIVGAGSWIYLATSRGGVQIVNVQNPRNPQAIDTMKTGGRVMDIRNMGTALVMATSSREILLADVSDATLELFGAIKTPSLVRRLAYCGARVYASMESGAIAVFDVSDRENPNLLHTVETGGPIADLAISGKLLFAAVGEELLIYDRTSSGTPRPVGAFAFSAPLKTIATAENRLYVGDKQGGINVLDLSNPAVPKMLGRSLLPWHMRNFSDMRQMTLIGDTLYIADGRNGLVIFDVRDSARPHLTGSLQFPGYVSGITVDGDWGYVYDFNNGLFQVDMRNPEKPQIVASLAATTQTRALIVKGKVLFATSVGDLRLLPLPTEVHDVRLIDSNRIEIALSPPEFPGNYTLRVFNGHRSAELPGAITVEGF